MTYILLLVLHISSRSPATMVAEFDTYQACQIAATEIRRQSAETGYMNVSVVTCTPKGGKK